MSVDFESIATRCRCETSSLKLAAPLLEQGLTPPFLARYRRDELSGIDEASLWALSAALDNEKLVAARREQLHAIWESTTLKDPSIESAIRKSASHRMLGRASRRLKSESDSPSDAVRLAVRILNPQKGDAEDLNELAAATEGITDAAAAINDLDAALAQRLGGDPRVISAAVRWLTRHARIKIERISDPHVTAEEPAAEKAKTEKPKKDASKTPPEVKAETDATKSADATASESAQPTVEAGASAEAAPTESAPAPAAPGTATPEPAATPESTETATTETPVADKPVADKPVAEAAVTEPADAGTPVADATVADATVADAAVAETTASETPAPEATTSSDATSGKATSGETPETSATPQPDATAKPDATATKSLPAAESKTTEKKLSKESAKKPAAPKKPKKISPRQRRRRWLVGVLKGLSGKQFDASKLSSFQIVMLARGLRSQVAECSFRYDATKLVAELQNAAGGLNRVHADTLREIVLKNEAAIREAAEAAWWEDLQERASAKLVDITADQLRRQMNRGGVQASVVLAIDAVGPKTAAASVVSADGQMVKGEDIACGLGKAQRALAVSKIGELIHAHHVDLIVISNGPARRAMMVALAELVAQSPEGSIRWTLAERSGADAYAGSDTASSEMRSTPRRFRSAAWLAFSVLHPAQALAKVDPLKLRLNAFQKELSETALSSAMEDIMVSGASRGGVDVNGTPAAWLSRLPGMNAERAKAIDKARRGKLFPSRQALLESGLFDESAAARQALPFLRVFGSEQTLDGTLVHPDDYALAERLAKSLEIELPPDSPPGYVAPDYMAAAKPDAVADLKQADLTPQPPKVEEFSAAAESATEFSIEEPPAAIESAAVKPATGESGTAESTPAAETPDSSEISDATPAEATTTEPATDAAEPSTEAKPEESASTPDPVADPETASSETSTSETGTPETAAETSSADSESAAPAGPTVIRQPLPEKAKIDKCVKEWQVGANRTQQIVHWLCEPFGDSDPSGSATAVMSSMPTLKTLKPGDEVVGIVVGIMPFGVFIELAPDCSGLVHISKLSDTFVDDLHEAVGVGDIVTAYVTGIDEKRRRVGLSLLSPEREAELEVERAARKNTRGYGGRGGQGAPNRGGANRGRGEGGQGSSQGGGQARGGQARGGQSRGGGGRPGGGGKPGGRGAGRSDNRGGSRRGPRQPESYRVASKKEAKPLTEEMKDGKEPLRSFGDLAQFLTKEKPVVKKETKQETKPAPSPEKAPAPPAAEAETQASPAPQELSGDGSSSDGSSSDGAKGEASE